MATTLDATTTEATTTEATKTEATKTASPLVRNALLLHSPMLATSRSAALTVADARIAPLARTGVVTRVTSHEHGDVAANVNALVDLDASHMPDPAFKPLVANIHVRQLSNAMKHLEALRIASATPDEDAAEECLRFTLVMEDDALFSDNVRTVLEYATRGAPADADVVFLGLPSPRAPTAGEALFDDVATVFPLLPACDSYLVTKAAAKRLADAFLPVRFVTNVHLSYLLRTLGLRSYVAVPNVFVDGSKIGVFASSLDSNNRLLWNTQYCQADAMVRGEAAYHPSAFDALWAQQPFKEHPDNLALRAYHIAKTGRHAEAETAFAEALREYDRHGCLVNNTSKFLREYTLLYRDLQQQPPPPPPPPRGPESVRAAVEAVVAI